MRPPGLHIQPKMECLQAAIAARLSEYPQQILKNIHHASAILPADLASVLQQEPQLVAPAVEAFHYRDPDSLRAARSMRHFPAKARPSLTAPVPSLFVAALGWRSLFEDALGLLNTSLADAFQRAYVLRASSKSAWI